MKEKTEKILICTSIALLLFCIFSSIYIFKNRKYNDEEKYPVIEYSDTSRMRYIAVPMLEEYLNKYVNNASYEEENINIASYKYKNSQLIAGDNEVFAVATIFEVEPKNPRDIGDLVNWGIYGDDGLIHCNWTFIIRKIDGNKYKLIDIKDTKEVIKELQLDNNTNLMEVVAEANKCSYKIENDKIYVTYDLGEQWVDTSLTYSGFVGDIVDNGRNSQLPEGSYMPELPKGSYYITPEKTAFISPSGDMILSEDKGLTWDKVKVGPAGIVGVRASFVGFTEDGFGYALLCGDRVMSWETASIFTSNDGGHNWNYIGVLEDEGGSSLSTGISFSTDKIGFISTNAGLERTVDGGKTWSRVEVDVPVDLKVYYDTPLVPAFKDGKGELLVGQGSDGDYGAAGSQFARFVSEDNGLTWTYSGEVIK
ncbi:WD40/YVTN/BNR-like repeat-containing protein [Clostridium paraputrificum]|uniref:WD40/YVTN/BNR-like repeat-containing protein n=1 Tax=Clostridium paraputrificum TaxID=29363 RepID=UPI0011CC60C1|nr:hypothetical protein [Clostridium paraputrificum]